MTIEINSIESERFGLVAAQVTDLHSDVQAILDAAARENVRLLTVRIPVSELSLVHKYESTGFQLMDTLVEYRRSPSDAPSCAAGDSAVRFRFGNQSDADAVASVARSAFSGYLGHYHADPNLDPIKADEAYIDWARREMEQSSPTSWSIVAVESESVIGFLILKAQDSAVLKIVLNAVASKHQGQGIYRQMLIKALDVAKEKEAAVVTVSTQINNYRAQSALSRVGFQHFRSFYTLHRWI